MQPLWSDYSFWWTLWVAVFILAFRQQWSVLYHHGLKEKHSSPVGLWWEVLLLHETLIFFFPPLKCIWCQIIPRFFYSCFVSFFWMSTENNGKAFCQLLHWRNWSPYLLILERVNVCKRRAAALLSSSVLLLSSIFAHPVCWLKAQM